MCQGMRRSSCVVAVVALGLVAGGCENKAQTGAVVGAGGGAAAGGIIGHQSGHAGTGALIGAGVGAIGGYIVGNEMDKKDARREEEAYQARTRAAREYRYEDRAPRAQATSAEARVTKQDVIAWTERGVKEDLIIDRIDRTHSAFRLSPADENELRDAGVSEEVIRTMKNTTRR
jgi:hypothetical protein